MPIESSRKPCTFRLDDKTREALERRAAALGTSQANAISVAIGAHPESAFAKSEKSDDGKRVTR